MTIDNKTKRPTKNGLYWLYLDDGRSPVVSVDEIDSNSPCIYFIGTEIDYDLNEYIDENECEWLGPISAP